MNELHVGSDSQIKELYFKWLCSIAFPDETYRKMFSNLLRILHSTEFRFVLYMDTNREQDGIDMRYHFSYATNIPFHLVSYIFDQNKCSVLEMMVSLAKRIEESIMSNPKFGDRTSDWFWIMFSNLDLSWYSNQNWSLSSEAEVSAIINRFLERIYSPDGRGGLFRNYEYEDNHIDMTKIEIWEQMNLWLTTSKME